MSRQPSLTPVLSIDMKKKAIRIHKQTLHLLGDPEYIQLLINPDSRLIAIRCSTREDTLAHRVKFNKCNNKNCFELYSKYLIQTLKKVNDGWEDNTGYRIYGHFNEKECIAQFAMNDIIVFSGTQEG